MEGREISELLLLAVLVRWDELLQLLGGGELRGAANTEGPPEVRVRGAHSQRWGSFDAAAARRHLLLAARGVVPGGEIVLTAKLSLLQGYICPL